MKKHTHPPFNTLKFTAPPLARTLVALCILCGAGATLITSISHWHREQKTEQQSTASLIKLRPTLPEPPVKDAQINTLPGFEKRGQALVGNVRGEDGSTMRLVFDVKSQKLIGLKVLEPAPFPKGQFNPAQNAQSLLLQESLLQEGKIVAKE